MPEFRSRRGGKRRSITASLAALVVTALALGGCASAQSSADAPQVLTVGSTRAEFTSLDSGAITSGGYESQRLIGNTIYEGLTRKDVSDPDTVAPSDTGALAESWEISEDGLTYTFSLREDVVFHDGTPWNAEAALFNLDRYMNTESEFYDATVSANYGVLNRVVSVEQVDEMTIAVTLDAVYPYFISDLYPLYFASPTSLRESGSAGQAVHPVGTGPFRFESQNGNEQLTLARNADYWGAVPLLDELVIVNIADPAGRVAALRSGRVDWIEGVSPDDIPSLESGGYVVTTKLFDWTWNWSYMTDKAPFDDPEVRLALNFAIDREAIATSLSNDTAVPLRQIMPEVNPLYDSSDDLYEYDPELAREMLADAGFADGLDITVSYPASGSGFMMPKEMNEALQAQLADVGVRVSFIVEDHPTFMASLSAPGGTPANARMAAGTMDLYSTWGTYLFGCGQSRYGYCNEEAQVLLDRASVTVDDDERGEILREIAGILTVDAPRLSVVSDTAPRAMNSAVQGYEQPRHWWIDFTAISMG